MRGSLVSVLVRSARFVFCPGPRNDWQAELNQTGDDHPRRKCCADMQPPEIATALRDVVLGQWTSKLVIRAVPLLCTVHWTWRRLADRPRLEAILLSFAV